jgi:hypothetical protein
LNLTLESDVVLGQEQADASVRNSYLAIDCNWGSRSLRIRGVIIKEKCTRCPGRWPEERRAAYNDVTRNNEQFKKGGSHCHERK